MTVALLAVGCTVEGSSSSGPGTDPANGPELTTTTGAEATPSTVPLSSGADPSAYDIDDTVLEGLGDPRIDVVSYDVEIHAEPEVAEIDGSVTIELRPRTDEPLESFTLDLRGPTIDAATVDGTAATVDTEPGAAQVEITPAEPLEPDSTATVEIFYGGVPEASDFALGLASIGWQLDDSGGWFALSEPDGTSSWVPVNDHPSDKATWTITLVTPPEVTGIANGILESSETVDGSRWWRWQMAEPIPSYVVVVAVGDYRLIERTGPDGMPLTIAVSEAFDPHVDDLFDEIDGIYEFFSETFGPPPFGAGGAIVVDRRLGVALETATRPIFGTDSVESDQVWALAHEIAHEWWGNSVTITDWGDLWLNEGFATYADWLYVEHLGQATIDEQLDWSGPPSALAVTDPIAARTFSGAVYYGAAAALHALRAEIGDDAFFAVLREHHSANRYSNTTTDEFVALAERVGGADLGTWRRLWLDSAPQPSAP